MSDYSLSRHDAADLLSVSTRTIDRYVKKGKISYKKIANNILLNSDEIMAMKDDYDMLKKEPSSEVVVQSTQSQAAVPITSHQSKEIATHISAKQLDDKLERFFDVFEKKEQMIEDKNKMIFVLQQRVGELETRLQTMVALPDYNQEKQQAINEKKNLEWKITQLQRKYQSESTKSTMYLWFLLILVFVIILIFFFMQE